MTQASQALPSWLTLSSTLVTDTDGIVSTSFATLTLPLTYYGPPIPLGTDGTWVYGGLSSPAPSSPAPTTPPPSSATPSPTIVSSLPPSTTATSPTLSSTSPSSATTPTPSSSTSPTSSVSPASSITSSSSSTPSGVVAPGHGISVSVLGAVLGSIIGAILLAILIVIAFFLWRNRRRRRSDPNGQSSSSFWNRQTTLFTRPGSRQTPIWTGWEIVNPDDFSPNVENGGRHSPGDGSPRGSGDEVDPFLIRHSLRSTTVAEDPSDMKTATNTLVSLPPAKVALGTSTVRSEGTSRSSPRTGHIIPRDVLLRMAEDNEPEAAIRIVEPSPRSLEDSPLLPPPRLDPDGLTAQGVWTGRSEQRGSVGSQATNQERSLGSQKSAGSLEMDPQESAELLTARRVRVGELGQSARNSAAADIEAGPSTSPPRSALGLNGLGGRLGRLSWFRRMSFTGAGAAAAASSSSPPASPRYGFMAEDPYTRTPPRTASRSRPGSRAGDLLDVGNTRRTRDSGIGSAASRPISSVSGKSVSAASGNTVYHDAISRPQSEMMDTSSPLPSPGVQQGGTPQAEHSPVPSAQRSTPPTASAPAPAASADPPAYDDDSIPRMRGGYLPLDMDVLDIPAPPPASPFSSSRPAFPPGLVPLPTPRQWRDSYSSGRPSPTTSRHSAGIAIDVLEEDPPTAQEGWRTLSGGNTEETRDERRTTFGTPWVVHHQQSFTSEHGSLHSTHPHHLSPTHSRSPLGSAPVSSHHTLAGSGSSRPSHHARSGSSNISSAHSGSISSGERSRPRRSELPAIRSPPLSAVFGGRSGTSSPRDRPSSPTSPLSLIAPLRGTLSATSSRAPLLGGDGTITSSTTGRSEAHSSVTTALTDPVTGTIMHFPSVPYRSGGTLERHPEWIDEDYREEPW